MTQNAEDFNRILNEINSKIDYMASHNDQQTLSALLNQVKTLEKAFNESLLNFNFEKDSIFEGIQKDITATIEKSTILKDLFPQGDESKIERIENTVNSGLSRVQNDLSTTIKNDFNSVAQGIGALYSKIEGLKNSIDNNTNLDPIKAEVVALGSRITELYDQLSKASEENILSILSNIKENNSRLNELGTNVAGNFNIINDNIHESYNISNEIKNQLNENFNTLNADLQKSNENTNILKNQMSLDLNILTDEFQKSHQASETIKEQAAHNLNIITAGIQKNIEDTLALQTKVEENLTQLYQGLQTEQLNTEEIKSRINENFEVLNSGIQKNIDNTTALQSQVEQNLNILRADIQNTNENTVDIQSKLTDNISVISEVFQRSNETALELRNKVEENLNFINASLRQTNEGSEKLNTQVQSSLSAIIENLQKSDSSLIGLKTNLYDKFNSVSEIIKNSDENLNEFKQNIAENLTTYLASIKDLFASFADEMHAHQESLSSEIFDKNLQKIDNLSNEINDLIEKVSSKDENNYREIFDKKIQEVSECVKSVENMVSASNISIGNSVSEMTEIKTFVSDTSAKLNEIVLNMSSSGSIKELNDTISNRFSNVDLKLDTIEDSLTKELNNNNILMEQINENLGTSVISTFDEIKVLLENLRENSHQISGSISEKINSITSTVSKDIETIVSKVNEVSDNTAMFTTETKYFTERKIEELEQYLSKVEEIISASTVNFDSSLNEITEIKEYIANTSLKLDDIGTNVAENVSKGNENIEDFKNIFTQRLDTINSKLYTMEDNLARTISNKLIELEQTKDDTNLIVNNNLNELKTIIEVLRANSTQNSNLVNEKLTEIGNTITQKFEQIAIRDEAQKECSDEIKNILNNVSYDIQTRISNIKLPEIDTAPITESLTEVQSSVKELSGNSTYVSDKLNEFGSTFTDKFDELALLNEERKIDIVELKTLINSVNEEIEKTRGNITETIANNFNGREDLFARIEDIKTHISAIKIAMADLSTESTDKITEKLFVIESKLYDSSETYEHNLSQLETKLSEYINNVELISAETNIKLGNSAEEFVEIKNNLGEIQDKLTYLNTDQKSFLEENMTSIIEKISDVTSELTAHREEIKIDIKEVVRENINFVDKGLEYLTITLDEIKSKQSDSTDEITNTVSSKLSDIRQEIELLNTDITEIYQVKSDSIIKEFEPLKSAIIDFTSFDFNEIIVEMKNQIEISYLNLLQELNKNLIENHDTYLNIENTYKDVVARCASLQECIDDFTKNNLELINSTIAGLDLNVRSNLEKTDQFLTEWQAYAENLDKKITENNSELERSLLNILDELQKTIDEKVKAGSAELKDFVAVMLNNEDLLLSIEGMNEEVINQIEQFKSSINSTNSDLQTSLTDIKKDVNDKFKSIQLELMDKPDADEQLTKFANLLKAALNDLQASLSEKLNLISAANDSQTDEKLIKMSDSLKELHGKIDILAMSDNSELQDEISNISENNSKISEKLNELHSKIDILAMDDNSELQDEISNISENNGKIAERLDELHSKVDILALNDNSDIQDELSGLVATDNKISEMLEALHSKVDILAMAEDSELKDEIFDVKELIYEQSKLFESFDNNKKAHEIENYLTNLLNEINKIDLEKNAQDIKDSVMSAILSVTDQMSFVEETEEIKDFVEEKTNAINQTLLDVKKQLNNIASSNSDMDFYSYTLQDVESDIAKLRLAMSEISSSNSGNEVGVISSNINRIAKSIEDLRSSLTKEQSDEMFGDFEKLNEDIISISTRTNKLLLNSDESYRIISDSMEEFNRRTDYLQEQLNAINAKNLENQLARIDQKVNATMSSSKVLENVMMYLGEWMDGTTELVNSIYDKSAKTTSIQEAINELKANVPQKQELLNIIENKFEEQQSRIDRLEKKLEKVLTLMEDHAEDVVQNKIDNIETQLAKLSSNIEKLTSYVDE